jgi:hypothetical protein
MTGKMKLYIGLLILGLVLIGGGVWLLFHPVVDTPAISENTSYSHLFPDSPPVISANISHVMSGEFNSLSIYGDGEIIYIKEEGLRMRLHSPEYPPTRTWRTGQLQEEELDSLLDFIKKSGFEGLEDRYKFPGEPIESNGLSGFREGDMFYTVAVNYGDLHKKVGASSYLTPDEGMTYRICLTR